MMIDTIKQYLLDYAPAFFMLVMMFIDRFGFGNQFSAFRKYVTDALNVNRLTEQIKELKDELRSALAENEEIRKELKEIREALSKVKGRRSKNEQLDERV